MLFENYKDEINYTVCKEDEEIEPTMMREKSKTRNNTLNQKKNKISIQIDETILKKAPTMIISGKTVGVHPDQ